MNPKSKQRPSRKLSCRFTANWFVALSLFVPLLLPPHAVGQETFYKGKTMRIIVAAAPGGGYDTYSRLIARHMGKHIPGNPTFIVENMPGGGQLIAANHIFKVVKPDGLTIGHFSGNLVINQVFDQRGVEFDMSKFEYVGAPTADHTSCAFTRASGITSAERWLASKKPVKMGGVGPGTIIDNALRVLKFATDLPIQIVSGYKGTAPIRLAMESGELAGSCWGWDSINSTWGKAIQSGDGIIVVQAGAKPHPDLPKVPLAINFAKHEEGRQFIDVVVHGGNFIERSYLFPPRTPKDRVQLMRRAFAKTIEDREFLAEAKKAKLGIGLIPGEDLDRSMQAFFKLSKELRAKLKDILFG